MPSHQCILLVITTGLLSLPAVSRGQELCRSPGGCVWLDADTVAVSDATFGVVYVVDAATGTVTQEVKLNGEQSGVAAAGGMFYVAETGAGTVAEIGADGVLTRRLPVGPRPTGLAVAETSRRLVVAGYGLGTLAVVDLATGTVLREIAVSGLPYAVAVTPDEKLAATVSRLPVGDARLDEHAAVLTLLDLATLARAAEVKLLSGTGNVTGLAGLFGMSSATLLTWP